MVGHFKSNMINIYIIVNNTEDDGNYCIAEFAGLIDDVYLYQLCYHIAPMPLNEAKECIKNLRSEYDKRRIPKPE
jgi:hypothetical protein